MRVCVSLCVYICVCVRMSKHACVSVHVYTYMRACDRVRKCIYPINFYIHLPRHMRTPHIPRHTVVTSRDVTHTKTRQTTVRARAGDKLLPSLLTRISGTRLIGDNLTRAPLVRGHRVLRGPTMVRLCGCGRPTSSLAVSPEGSVTRLARINRPVCRNK